MSQGHGMEQMAVSATKRTTLEIFETYRRRILQRVEEMQLKSVQEQRRLQKTSEKVRSASPDLWDQKANSWNASAQGLEAVSVRTELKLLWEQFKELQRQIELLPVLKGGAEKVFGRLRPPEDPPPFLTPALNAGSIFSKINASSLKVLNLRASFNGRPEELSRQAKAFPKQQCYLHPHLKKQQVAPQKKFSSLASTRDKKKQRSLYSKKSTSQIRSPPPRSSLAKGKVKRAGSDFVLQ